MTDLTLQEIEKGIFQEISENRKSQKFTKLPKEIDENSWLDSIRTYSKYAGTLLHTDEELEDAKTYIINKGNVRVSRMFSIELAKEDSNSDITVGSILGICGYDIKKELAQKLDDYLETVPSRKVASDLKVRLSRLDYFSIAQADYKTFEPVLNVTLVLRFNMFVR